MNFFWSRAAVAQLRSQTAPRGSLGILEATPYRPRLADESGIATSSYTLASITRAEGESRSDLNEVCASDTCGTTGLTGSAKTTTLPSPERCRR